MTDLTAAFVAWEQTAASAPGSHGTLSHEITIRDLATGQTLTRLITPGQAAALGRCLNITEETGR